MKKLKMYSILLTLILTIWIVNCEDVCPISCYCDSISRYVHCEGEPNNNLKLLSGEIPKFTQRLELRDFQLGTLKWEITRGLLPSGLIELSIRKSDIIELTNGSLTVLNKLNNLDLSHNNIYLIQQGTFDQLISLRHLDLGWNNLKEIKTMFFMLKNLETLDLSNNKLEILTLKTFSGLQNIQWLDISYNKITKIEPGTFLPMPNLERLVLGNNPLTSLQRLEFLGARLRYMDVSDLKLKRAPESLGTSVRELRATGNELKTLQRGDLDSYPSLTLLDLSYNQLEIIEDDALGRLEYLSRIWLIGNKLEKIPNSLPRSLRVLYLDRNKVRVINTADLQGLPRLQQLTLSQNKITTISSELLSYLPGLRRLDLSNNLLKTATFGPNGLEELNLSNNNELSLKPGTFSTLPHLRILHLANISQSLGGSNLKELMTPLSELTSLNLAGSSNLAQEALNSEIWYGLHELNLQNTSLNTLPTTLWSNNGKLRILNLSNNPWNCSLNDLQLKITTRDSRLKIIDSNDLKCKYPENLRGVSLLINVSKEVTAPPSLAPTRVQIAPPTSIQPNATSKPESTAPLNYESDNTIQNEVDKTITTKLQKKNKLKLQSATTSINNKLNTSLITENLITTTPFNNLTHLINTTNNEDNFTTEINLETIEDLTNITTEIPILNTTTIEEVSTTNNIIDSINTSDSTIIIKNDIDVTTDIGPVDYEELAIVIEEEEFYEEPVGNFSELRAGKIQLASEVHTPNIPVGFLSVLGACMLGAVVVALYHCRQQRKWQRLQTNPQEEMLNMDVLTSEEKVRW